MIPCSLGFVGTLGRPIVFDFGGYTVSVPHLSPLSPVVRDRFGNGRGMMLTASFVLTPRPRTHHDDCWRAPLAAVCGEHDPQIPQEC